MASESRQKPASNITRRAAINTADTKNTALGAASYLSPATKTRLVAIKSSYNSRYNAIAVKKHDMAVLTNQKNVFAATSRMMNSHFVQVFNLGVDRAVFAKEDRAFYQIDINSASIPDMATVADLLQVGSDLVTGDAARVTAGGIDMAMPAIAEVETAHTSLSTRAIAHSTAKDAYDEALEALDALNEEADGVIKKVWDEVETYFNEEEPASQRDNAREWGVIYVQIGSNKKISGTVRDSITSLPIEDARIAMANGNKTVTSGPDGRYELGTTLMGDQEITAESDLHNEYTHTLTLVENQDKTWDILLVPAV